MSGYLAVLGGLAGLLFAFKAFNELQALSASSGALQELNNAGRPLISSFVRKGYTLVLVISAVMFLVLWAGLNFEAGISFLTGALCASAASLLATRLAQTANSRIATALLEGSQASALMTAFKSASVYGLAAPGLLLTALGALFIAFAGPAEIVYLTTFVLGLSLCVWFLRLSSAIFPGQSCVESSSAEGKETGDLSTPNAFSKQVIDWTDWVVGRFPGLSLGFVESFVFAIIAPMLIAVSLPVEELSLLGSVGGDNAGDAGSSYRLWLMSAPLILVLLGFLSSVLGIKSMSHLKYSNPHLAHRNSRIFALIVLILLSFLYFLFSPLPLKLWFVVLAGLLVFGGVSFLDKNLPQCNNEAISRKRIVIFPLAILFIVLLFLVFSMWVASLYGVALLALSVMANLAIMLSVTGASLLAEKSALTLKRASPGLDSEILERADRLVVSRGVQVRTFSIASRALALLAVLGACICSAGPGELFQSTWPINPLVLVGILPAVLIICIISGLVATHPVWTGVGNCEGDTEQTETCSGWLILLIGLASFGGPVLVFVLLGYECLLGFLLSLVSVGQILLKKHLQAKNSIKQNDYP